MSSIILNRLINYIDPNESCENEEEVEEENYNFNNADVDSKNYLVNLYKNLKNCYYLLNSMIEKEKLDYIVICLFKNHEFSVGIKLFNSDCVCERVRFICEDSQILNYIDNEELPPILIDIIEKLWLKNIYYNGCIISEIRDYRQSSTTSNFFNSYFILLKPTSLSLYNDVKKIINLTNRNYNWTNSTKFKLESKLIYLTSPKLCLDPNPCIGLLSKKLSRKKLIFCNKLFLRLPRKRLKRTIIANERLKEFKLLNFLKTKKNCTIPKMKNSSQFINTVKPVDIDYKDIKLIAKDLKEQNDDSYELVKVEEYTMEFIEMPNSTFTKLIIYRRPFDDIYFGTLVNNKNGDSKGPPNFYLGSKTSKRKYIDQFIEIFTENGRKSIKITQQVENEPPKIKLTPAAEYYIKRKLALRSTESNNGSNNGSKESSPNTLLLKGSYSKSPNIPNSSQTIIIKSETLDSCNELNPNVNKASVSSLVGQAPTSTIRVPNIITQKRLTSPMTLSVYPPTTSTTLNNTASKISLIDHEAQAVENVQNSKAIITKTESDNNHSVTYMSANLIMPGSTVFTVQTPSSVEVMTSTQNQSDTKPNVN